MKDMNPGWGLCNNSAIATLSFVWERGGSVKRLGGIKKIESIFGVDDCRPLK